MYYRNAQAALVVYDITKASSLTKAQHWVAELQRSIAAHAVLLTYTVIALFPVFVIVVNSFKNRRAIFADPLALPR